jgi:very-short-patch-repair endonuclease
MALPTFSDLLILASQQHGVLHRSQAHLLGWSDSQLRIAVREGVLVPHLGGVFVAAGAFATSRQQLGVLALGTKGVVSHRSALWLDGLLDRPPRPEVTVSPRVRRRGRSGALIHRSVVEACEVRTLDGLVVTSTARSLLDAAHRLTPTRLEAVIDRALDMHLTDHEQLAATFLRRSARGRPGIATARLVLDRVDPGLAPGESDLETLMLDVLRAHGVPMPQRQIPVSVLGERYRLDLAYIREKVVLEVDGYGTHALRPAFEGDRLRQNRLALQGWLVLRFTWRRIRRDPAGIAAELRQALALRALAA